jgi:hypothetical protein
MPDQPEQRPTEIKLPAPPRAPDAGHIPITEELDRAKWTLPPVHMILIGIAAFAVIFGAILLFWKHKDVPAGSGGISEAYAVETSTGVMVAVQFSARNTTDGPLYVKNIAASLNTGGKDYTDDHAASPIDYERYEKAFPDLKQHVTKAVPPETRVNSGQEISGSAIFAFDGINKQAFDSRSGLKLTITYFDFPRAMVVQEKK